MKTLLIIAITLAPLSGFGQSTVADTVNYELDLYRTQYPDQLGSPNFDSLSLELRIWVSGHYFSDSFIKMSRSNQGEWNFSRGFINHERKRVVSVPNHKNDLNLDSLFQILQSYQILTLPDQKKSSIIIPYNGKNIHLDQETKERIIDDRRGEFYIIEVYQPQFYRQYGYYAPESIHKMCAHNNYICQEHEMMNNIASVILQHFQIRDILVAQFKERYKKER